MSSVYNWIRQRLPASSNKLAILELIDDYQRIRRPYEPEVCAIIKEIVKPGWVCVDAGAYIGYITLLLAKLVGPRGQVIAFEALPRNAARTRRNVAVRGLAKRVRVENMAVTDDVYEHVELFPGREGDLSEWNILGHDVTGRVTQPKLQVPAISLDKYFAPGSCVDFVKLDIEGAEGLVLEGMRRILREAKPVLVIEFHYAKKTWPKRKELYEAGYTLYDMHKQKIASDSPKVYHCLALPPGFHLS